MKANIWSNTELGVGKTMANIKDSLKSVLESGWLELGQRKNPKVAEKTFQSMVNQDMHRMSDGPLERGRNYGYRDLQP